MEGIWLFCLSSNINKKCELEASEDIKWKELLGILCEKLHLLSISSMQLFEPSVGIVGERITSIDDFLISCKYYNPRMFFKVFGAIAPAARQNTLRGEMRQSTYQSQSQGFDSLLTSTPVEAAYNPLDEYSLTLKSAKNLPKPDQSINVVPLDSKTERSESPSIVANIPMAPSISYSIDRKNNLLTTQELIGVDAAGAENAAYEEIDGEEEWQEEGEEEYHEEEESHQYEGSQLDCGVVDDTHELKAVEEDATFDTRAPHYDPVPNKRNITTLPSRVNMELSSDNSTNPTSVEKVSPTGDPSLAPSSVNNGATRMSSLVPSTEEDNGSDFASSIHLILAGLSRLESSIDLSPSPPQSSSCSLPPSSFPENYHLNPNRPNMAALKTSAELELEQKERDLEEKRKKFEEEERRKKFEEEEEAARLLVLQQQQQEEIEARRDEDRMRKQEGKKKKKQNNSSDVNVSGAEGKISPRYNSSDSYEDNDSAKSAQSIRSGLSQSSKRKVEVSFKMNGHQSDQVVILSAPERCDWPTLQQVLASGFGVKKTNSIADVVLVDEDGDEVSGKISDSAKFWKFFERLISVEGRYFLVNINPSVAADSPPSRPLTPVAPPSSPPESIPWLSSKGSVNSQSSGSTKSQKSNKQPPFAVPSTIEVRERHHRPQTDRRPSSKLPVTSLPLNSAPAPQSTSGAPVDRSNVPPPLNSSSTTTPTSSSYYFRLSTDYMDQREEVEIPPRASWSIIGDIIASNLDKSHSSSRVDRISLFDDDGDEIAGPLENEEMFWKVALGRYRKDTTFVATLALSVKSSAPSSRSAALSTPATSITVKPTSLSSNLKAHVPIVCRLAPSGRRETVSIPSNSTWDEISGVVLNHFHVEGKIVTSAGLVDDEGDEIFGGIGEEKKFWKCATTHYKADSMEFVFSLANAPPPPPPPPPIIQPHAAAIPLRFRLADTLHSSAIVVRISADASWDQICSSLADAFKLVGQTVDSLELVDTDDDSFGSFQNDQRFWKSAKGAYTKGVGMVYCISTRPVPVVSPRGQSSKKLISPTGSPPVSPRCLSLYFRLCSDDITVRTSVQIAEGASWQAICDSLLIAFHLPSRSTLLRIDLVDSDGDDTIDNIETDKKFWKAVNAAYNPDESTFLATLDILYPTEDLPSVSNALIFFCLKGKMDEMKEIEIPLDTSWPHLLEILGSEFNISEGLITQLNLVDYEGDEYCNLIQDEAKFWKAFQSQYEHSGDLAFVIPAPPPTAIRNRSPLMPSTKLQSIPSKPQTTLLSFSLTSDRSHTCINVEVTEGGTWETLSHEIVNAFDLPLGSTVKSMDLIDDDSDVISVDITSDSKFWKSVKKGYCKGSYFLVAYSSPQPAPKSIPTMAIYFRLSTDSFDDKAMFDIPIDCSWEEIVQSIETSFSLPSQRTIGHLDLVDEDGDNLFQSITNAKKFWKAAHARYQSESTVFVASLVPKYNFESSDPPSHCPVFSFCLSLGDDNQVEVAIPEDSPWNEICEVLASKLKIHQSAILSLQLYDQDGDEVFSRITDGKKFWKAAFGKYVAGETYFLLQLDSRASSQPNGGDFSPISTYSGSSLTTTTTNTTLTTLPSRATTSAASVGSGSALTVVKTKESRAPLPPPAPTNQQRAPPQSPARSSGFLKEPVKGLESKVQGKVVSIAFKLTSDYMNDKTIALVPAMGSWEQICSIVFETFELPDTTVIDRIDLFDDEGDLLVGNIVSSSKFWKACLDRYDDQNTVFNVTTQKSAPSRTPSASQVGKVPPLEQQRAPSLASSGSLSSENITVSSKATASPRGVDPNVENFLKACSDGNIDDIASFFRQGGDINAKDDMNITGLHVACIRGKINVVQLLVEKEASLTSRDLDGMTPLHFACEHDHTEVVMYLVRMGADTSLRNKGGLTSLHYICMNGNMQLTPLFREYMINVATSTGLTLLHCAADMGHADMIIYLVENGAQVQPRDDEGLTPLHMACMGGHLDAVKALIELGAYWNIRDDEGMSPMLYACQEAHVHVLNFLCSAKIGANIHARNDKGDTALHLGSAAGSLEIVKFLIQRKVEINPRNQNGETPLEVASACDHDEIVVWLEDRGATMRPETTQDANTRKQIDSKTEKAARAFEAEEMLGLIRHSTKKK